MAQDEEKMAVCGVEEHKKQRPTKNRAMQMA